MQIDEHAMEPFNTSKHRFDSQKREYHLAPRELMLYERVASHGYRVRTHHDLINWKAQVHATKAGDARCLDVNSLYSHTISRN